MPNQTHDASSTCCLPHVPLAGERPEARLAALFEALADPSRIELLIRMLGHVSCIVGPLASGNLDPTEVKDQIHPLRRAGLIQGVIEGPAPCFCINSEAFIELSDFLRPFTGRKK